MNKIKIEKNKESWNKKYVKFSGWCALPTWGPYEMCKNDSTLIGKIKGKTFLELCCGSGHSVKYLIENGAKKVYAVDFSENQINLARAVNKKYLNKIKFILSPIEKKINLPEKIDVIFSIYGIGWTLDPVATFSNVFSYLKDGGKFIWSWDHSIFFNSREKNGDIVVKGSYYDENEKLLETSEKKVEYFTSRKTSTWFQLLRDAGFEINRYLEPKPFNINEDIATISDTNMAIYYNPLKAEKIPSVIIFECFKPSHKI